MKKMNIFKKKIVTFVFLCTMSIIMTLPAYADTSTDKTISEILQPLDTLKTLFLAAMSIIGYILVGKNLYEVVTAYQQNDSHSLSSGIKGFLGGVLIAGIGTVLTLLGL